MNFYLWFKNKDGNELYFLRNQPTVSDSQRIKRKKKISSSPVWWCSRLPGELASRRLIRCRGPKCLKVVWLTTRAEERPLILLVISQPPQREAAGSGGGYKKKKKAPSLAQISRSIKVNAAEPGSPYRSSLPEIYPPYLTLDPRRWAPERQQRDEWPTLLQRSMSSQTAAPGLFCSLCSL